MDLWMQYKDVNNCLRPGSLEAEPAMGVQVRVIYWRKPTKDGGTEEWEVKGLE